MATIITKNSQTASAVPSAASLSVGELAVNTADGKLYTEHTGGVVKEIIPSTVVDGGITEAKIASNAVTTAKIADANVTGAKLENSGVTAGSYGSSSAIPVVTVDAKGRLTSVSTTSVSASAPTTTQVLNAYAGLVAGGISAYMFGTCGVQTPINPNDNRSGSQLSYVTIDTSCGVINLTRPFGTNNLSGTWKAMNGSNVYNYGAYNSISLWCRIA